MIIQLKHTQHGWLAMFADNDRWIHTAFTRHATGEMVESAIKALNPGCTVYVTGGR
jgi:hypothetical protein